MLNSYKYKEWLNWPMISAHLCTLAISVSLNATWKVPRDAFKYGGLTYGLVLTAAMLIVALPITLLQLAIGQLSQQDAVGVWRAVPFFRGIGYLRIIISLMSSAYTSIYVSLCIAYLLYTTSNFIPFPDCIKWNGIEGDFENPVNASKCLSITFMAPVDESPEYYAAIAFLIVVLWIICPFVFYNPIKLMKRIFYALGPATLLLGVITLSCIGNMSSLQTFVNRNHWEYYLEPNIWKSGIIQALWSCQIAGGYLISAGDSVYNNTKVQWTSLAVVSANIISSWFWLLFWFAVSRTGDKDTSVLAVLIQTYQVTIEKDLSMVWPLLMFAILILSGIIVLFALVYPIYDRLRRCAGTKWRLATFASSLGGAVLSLAMLVGRLPALTLIEDIAVPVLIFVATVLEILAFGFIYGWKTLIEDVEFLIGSDLSKYWVWGWWLSPAVTAPFITWWIADVFARGSDWSEPSGQDWQAVTVLGALALALFTLVLCACVAVARQVQYDIIAKLKSSFQPTRHWGPRDPITHYHWLAMRDESERGNLPRTRYNRRELGQLSRRPSFLTVSESIQSNNGQISPETKKRSNSDDWVYTIGRKEYLSQYINRYVDEKKRSKSLDWEVIIKMRGTDIINLSRDNSVLSVKNKISVPATSHRIKNTKSNFRNKY